MQINSFSEIEYFKENPDVAEAVKAGMFISGQQHYELYGKGEGRLLNRLPDETLREARAFHLSNRKGLGLEIGPCHNPIAPKKKGFNVHILDQCGAAELRKKYKDHNLDLENIEKVDFIWKGEPYQKLIGKTSCYDWIIASHVIEYVPDLIRFFQSCEALLKSAGTLSLVIPDRRYCFNYFSASSSTGSVLDAYAEKRVKPSQGQIFDHFANASKLHGNIAWSSDVKEGADELIHTFDGAKEQWTNSFDKKEEIDAHCWRFTPASFRLLISDLLNLGLINLEIKAEFPTTGCEFQVSLGKKGDAPIAVDRLAALQAVKLENS